MFKNHDGEQFYFIVSHSIYTRFFYGALLFY